MMRLTQAVSRLVVWGMVLWTASCAPSKPDPDDPGNDRDASTVAAPRPSTAFDRDPFFRTTGDPGKGTPDISSPGKAIQGRPIPESGKPDEEQKIEADDTIRLIREDLLDFLEAKLAEDLKFQRSYRTDFDRAIRDNKHFIALMRDVYTQRNHIPLFFQFDEQRLPFLSDEGKRLLELLGAMESHGLPPQDYRLDRLQAGVDGLAEAIEAYRKIRTEFGHPAAIKLWTIVEKTAEIPDSTWLAKELREAGLTNDDRGAVNLLARFYPNLSQAKKRINDTVQGMDIALLHGFFQFNLDFRYVFKAHPFEPTKDRSLAHARFQDELRNDFAAASPEFARFLQDRIPPHPTYHKLRTAYQHYRTLRVTGDVDRIAIKRNLKPGSRGKEVRDLARRLNLEGYLSEQYVGERFGPEIETALKAYQRTHQLDVDGATGRHTQRSLNVSMKQREDDLALGLQRWRESQITRDRPEFYLRVNIPQFELEIWEGDTMVRKHRVIVGNRDDEVNVGRKQRGRFNHTPLLSSKMNRIVLNPLWYPPPRLRKELLAELEKEPDYFERNNFGIEISSSGSEIVFQKAGPKNALGQVKFLFPNPHSVYLHDTPKKSLFSRSIRSYSHGCVRVDKPLDLAFYLLEKINGMTRSDIQKILDDEKERSITLQNQPAIYIEYVTVGVDDEGRAEFYFDVYRYDRAYYDGQLPVMLTEDLREDELDMLRGDGMSGPSGLDVEDFVMPGT